ncbi:MAG: YbhB/YbcL family Raf kinase inhibitor-like protein [Chloroflexota bacterium]|nr:YbhB/YbcL family Raf kinase inhibitor-like protein [Chloroflexota bacterium]
MDAPQTRLALKSTAFEHGQMMPSECTCDGDNVSPDLSWEGAPEEANTFVIIAEDRDIPMQALHLLAWVHWVVYDIPPDVTSLPGGLPSNEVLDNGARQGMTSFKRVGYSGPCPPFGTHRYYFRLYAVDSPIGIEPRHATRKRVLRALQGHVVGYGELMGRYRRAR